MSSKSIIRQAKLNEWASRFADQKASGLSVIDWCSQKGISKDTFFYWKRKLRDELVEKVFPDIVPISLPASPVSVPVGLPIQSHVTDNNPTTPSINRASCTTCTNGPCARVYINGMTLEFDASAPDTLIMNVIKAVRHV